jgi:hypothetical protein
VGPYDRRRRGTGLVAHPVFKTGRAGQPLAWKVRFLRRVVAASVRYSGSVEDGSAVADLQTMSRICPENRVLFPYGTGI